MEFITDNYIWIIIIIMVIIITLIGYFADKTNYIEKQKEKNNEKKKNIEKQKNDHTIKIQRDLAKKMDDHKNAGLNENIAIKPEETNHELDELSSSEKPKTSTDSDLHMKKMDLDSEKQEIQEEQQKDIEKPLENSVLNLDLYDTNSDEAHKDQNTEETIEFPLLEKFSNISKEIEKAASEDLMGTVGAEGIQDATKKSKNIEIQKISKKIKPKEDEDFAIQRTDRTEEKNSSKVISVDDWKI